MHSSRPWGVLVTAVLVGGVGVLLAVSPLLRPGGSALLSLTGLTLVAIAVALWLFAAASPTGRVPVERTGTDADPAVRVPLRPYLPLANLLIFGALTVLVATGMLAIGLGDGGLFLLPVLLLVAAPVPDTVRALLRRPALTLTSRAASLRGWGIDAEIDWDDVTGVDIVAPHPRRPVLRIVGRPGATSFGYRMRRLVLPLDTRPDAEHVDVRLQGLGNPGQLQVAIEELARMAEPDRRVLLGDTALRLLTADLR